jgi:hypothetical protein
MSLIVGMKVPPTDREAGELASVAVICRRTLLSAAHDALRAAGCM